MPTPAPGMKRSPSKTRSGCAGVPSFSAVGMRRGRRVPRGRTLGNPPRHEAAHLVSGRARKPVGRAELRKWWSIPIPLTRHRLPLRLGMLVEVARLRTGDALLVAGSPLFDEGWYRRKYPDVTGGALTHYLKHGAWEGRDPCAVFDSAFYLKRHPE